MPDPTEVTLRTYEAHADRYTADRHSAEAAFSADVLALLEALVGRLPAGARVLEIGTGPGMEADYLEDRGLAVDRTDAAPAFVRRLREQGHGARLLDVRHGDLGGPHDAILANAVLLHLDRQAAALALAACRDAVRPGGLLALTLKEGDGEAWSSAKLSDPRWFVYWRKDALQDLLAAAGWKVLSLRQVQGRTEPWLHALCER